MQPWESRLSHFGVTLILSVFLYVDFHWEIKGQVRKRVVLARRLRRGCKRSSGPREQEASCTGAKWGCTGAKEGLGGAKDSWETFAPWAQKSQKDLLHPPLTTFGDFPFWGNFPGPQHPNPRGHPREVLLFGTFPPPCSSAQCFVKGHPKKRL